MWKWFVGVVGAIFAAVIAGVILLPLVGNGGGAPSITNIDSEIISIGQQVNISVANVDLVSEVLLVKGDDRLSIPFVRADGSKLTVTLPDDLGPGEYDIEFKTT